MTNQYNFTYYKDARGRVKQASAATIDKVKRGILKGYTLVDPNSTEYQNLYNKTIKSAKFYQNSRYKDSGPVTIHNPYGPGGPRIEDITSADPNYSLMQSQLKSAQAYSSETGKRNEATGELLDQGGYATSASDPLMPANQTPQQSVGDKQGQAPTDTTTGMGTTDAQGKMQTVTFNGNEYEIGSPALAQAQAEAKMNPQGQNPEGQLQPIGNMTTPSLVDYLNSIGMDSSKQARAKLAEQNGIQNYAYTADQNTQLLKALRGKQPTMGSSSLSAGVSSGLSGGAISTDTSTPEGQSASNDLQSKIAQIEKAYGLSAKSNTPQGVIDVYKKFLDSQGTSSIKAEFDKALKAHTDLQNELDDKIADINDNPWLTEGVRVNQINKLKERYATKLDALTNEQTLYESMYEKGVQQAQFLTGELMTAQYHDQTMQIDAVNKAIEIAQKEYEAEAKLKEPATTDIAEYQYAKKQGYTGSFTDYQKEQANLKSGVGGLTPYQTQQTINQITSQFDNEPVVRNYNVVAEGYNFAQTLANKTNPTSADDQGLIYAFAKAMDPNSAVREGEYTTVQKYAQSFIQTGWANAQRLTQNVAFLTPEARQNMVATINSRYQASYQNYQNIQNEYQRRIDDAMAGGINGSLTNYAGAFDNSSSGSGGEWDF